MNLEQYPARHLYTLAHRTWVGGIAFVWLISSLALGQPPDSAPRWTFTGNLNTSRHGHAAVLLPSGKVMVVGGITHASRGLTNSVEIYDPATGTWSVTGSLNLPRGICSVNVLADGKVLVAGGNTNTEPPSFGVTNTAEIYDPATETWSFTGELNVARSWHTAAALSGGVMVFGGGTAFTSFNSAEIYEPEMGTWTFTGDLLKARYGLTGTLLRDGKLLVAGGSDDGDLASTLANVELYDPVTKIWTSRYSLGTARISHTATLLPSGAVLVAGGYNWPPTSFALSELYDPATEQWTYTGNLREPRDQHAAVLLPDGKVLVTGGFNWSSRAHLDSSEIYDPAAGTWSDTGRLNNARACFTATLLRNGKVLVAGGATGGIGGSDLATSELYDSGGAVLDP